MTPSLVAPSLVLLPVALWVGMLVATALGRWLRRRSGSEQDSSGPGLGAIDGAIFALLGLLIAFTFSGAAARFDVRRELGVAEANALGTAWLRLEVLDEPARGELRARLLEYVGTRVNAYAALPDREAALEFLARSEDLGPRLFSAAVEACRAQDPSLRMLVLPPLNEALDLLTSRVMALRHHPPGAIFGLLGLLALVSALLAGRALAASARPPRLHLVGYATIVSLAVAVTLDLEYPRFGLMQVTAVDAALQDLQADMQSTLAAPPEPGSAPGH